MSQTGRRQPYSVQNGRADDAADDVQDAVLPAAAAKKVRHSFFSKTTALSRLSFRMMQPSVP